MMKFLKILITLIGSITCLYSQHNNNWKFGSYTGLNFNTPVPTLSVGQSGSYDYTSTMSDNNGALLFYTDGITVWDKNNNVMPNGSGLIGSFTAGQCALIVPVPCSQSKYVIFHVTDYGNPGDLHYTVVDMN